MDKKLKILVTGTIGNQSSAVVRCLLADGFAVRAMTHQPNSPKANELQKLGAEVIYANFDDPALLYSALSGVKAVFAVLESRSSMLKHEEERASRLAYLAKEQDVDQFVYSSMAAAGAGGVPHFEVKGRVEATIKRLNFKSHTFLRSTFLMERLLDPSFFPEIGSGKIILPMSPDVRLQLISAQDVAQFALFSFRNPDLMNGVEIDLAGDEHTFGGIAQVLSNAFKRDIKYSQVDMERYVQLRGMSPYTRRNFERIKEFWEMIGWDIDIGGLMLASRNFGIDIKTLNEWAQSIAPKYGDVASTIVPTNLAHSVR